MSRNLKIVPLEDANCEDDEIVVSEVTVTYWQKGDCTEKDEDIQTLTLSTRDNGTARFVNLKTENWSIDDPNDLAKLVDDFCKRASLDLTEPDVHYCTDPALSEKLMMRSQNDD